MRGFYRPGYALWPTIQPDPVGWPCHAYEVYSLFSVSETGFFRSQYNKVDPGISHKTRGCYKSSPAGGRVCAMKCLVYPASEATTTQNFQHLSQLTVFEFQHPHPRYWGKVALCILHFDENSREGALFSRVSLRAKPHQDIYYANFDGCRKSLTVCIAPVA